MVHLIVLLSLLTTTQVSAIKNPSRQYAIMNPESLPFLRLRSEVEKISNGQYTVGRHVIDNKGKEIPGFFILNKADAKPLRVERKLVPAEQWLAQQNQNAKKQTR